VLESDFKRSETQAPTAQIKLEWVLNDEYKNITTNLIDMIQCNYLANSTIFPTYGAPIMYILTATGS